MSSEEFSKRVVGNLVPSKRCFVTTSLPMDLLVLSIKISNLLENSHDDVTSSILEPSR
jgi:hypothetical protein